MGTISRGKQFEKLVGEQLASLKDTAVIRLYDVTMGYKNINNPCDFVVYTYPKMILLECKTTKGHLLNFAGDIRENQWTKLLEFSKIDGIVAGILVWFYEINKTFFIDIRLLAKLKKSGKKSFNASKDTPTIEIQGKKKRVFNEYYWERFIKEIVYE